MSDVGEREAMHQDQRIGLALGVLLVGACAAFFFRNEGQTSSVTPRLKHSQELDERIAERSIRPYLKGVEVIEASDQRQNGGEFVRSRSTWNPFRGSAGQKISEDASHDHESKRKPLNNSQEVQELGPITVSVEPMISELNTVSKPSDSTTQSEAGIPSDELHVVQKGETLCSIATKTLGNSARFHELFEANQDQLTDPNDVKQGMTLRIPRSGSETNRKSSGATARTAEPSHATPNVLASPAIESVTESVPKPIQLTSPVEIPTLDENTDQQRGRQEENSTIVLPPTLNDEPPSSNGDPTPLDSPSVPKRFVPSRRSQNPERQFEPQSKLNSGRESAGRRLSQKFSESRPGTVAR